MSTPALTRAWTDVEFRSTLTADERDVVANPAGDLDAEMDDLGIQEATATTTFCTKWSVTNPRRCCC